MGGHARLVEQDGLRRIYARGEQRRRHVAGVGAQLRRVVADRDRVQIGEEEQAVTACRGEIVLHRHPADDRPQIIAEVKIRSEEHTSELQSLMRISYAVFCLKKKKKDNTKRKNPNYKKNNKRNNKTKMKNDTVTKQDMNDK